MSARSSSSSKASAPLFITIGPPACGKTTFLRQQQTQQQQPNGKAVAVIDIAIDDHPGIYVPVDSRHYLEPAAAATADNSHDSGNSTSKSSDSNLLQQMWFDSTLQERINRDQELQLVCRRCAGFVTSQEEMKQSLSSILQTSNSSHLFDQVASSYESVFAERGDALALPNTTDLYVFESIFKPNPLVPQQSALQATREALFRSQPSQPIAWGNTNTKASDYAVALQMAAEQQRPVHFVVCDPRPNDNKVRSWEAELPDVGYEGLLKRNLKRFLDTGRYVPAKVISDMLQRTSSLLDQVEQQWQQQQQTRYNNNRTMSRLDRDKILASLAGFEMIESQRVIQRRPQQQQQHRYQGGRNHNNQFHPGPQSNFNSSTTTQHRPDDGGWQPSRSRDEGHDGNNFQQRGRGGWGQGSRPPQRYNPHQRQQQQDRRYYPNGNNYDPRQRSNNSRDVHGRSGRGASTWEGPTYNNRWNGRDRDGR